jgi:hypothetical protein
MAKPSFWVNFAEALLSVLLGNLVYYLVMPLLPSAFGHRPFETDLGLVVDFAFCAALLSLIRWSRRWR